ncbi:MAG: hypothetical protein ACO3UU_11065 [Minisyncoccia bacterium]
MKERIRLIANKAEQWADNQNFYASDYQDHMMEKFAELIVADCIRIMEHAYDNKLRLSDAVWNTKLHFEID